MKLKELYIIKLWDSCDKKWVNVGKPADLDNIKKKLNQLTKDGTVYMVCNKGNDHFKIFKFNDNVSIKKMTK